MGMQVPSLLPRIYEDVGIDLATSGSKAIGIENLVSSTSELVQAMVVGVVATSVPKDLEVSIGSIVVISTVHL